MLCSATGGELPCEAVKEPEGRQQGSVSMFGAEGGTYSRSGSSCCGWIVRGVGDDFERSGWCWLRGRGFGR